MPVYMTSTPKNDSFFRIAPIPLSESDKILDQLFIKHGFSSFGGMYDSAESALMVYHIPNPEIVDAIRSSLITFPFDSSVEISKHDVMLGGVEILTRRPIPLYGKKMSDTLNSESVPLEQSPNHDELLKFVSHILSERHQGSGKMEFNEFVSVAHMSLVHKFTEMYSFLAHPHYVITSARATIFNKISVVEPLSINLSQVYKKHSVKVKHYDEMAVITPYLVFELFSELQSELESLMSNINMFVMDGPSTINANLQHFDAFISGKFSMDEWLAIWLNDCIAEDNVMYYRALTTLIPFESVHGSFTDLVFLCDKLTQALEHS